MCVSFSFSSRYFVFCLFCIVLLFSSSRQNYVWYNDGWEYIARWLILACILNYWGPSIMFIPISMEKPISSNSNVYITNLPRNDHYILWRIRFTEKQDFRMFCCIPWIINSCMGLLPDIQNDGLCVCWECREHFLRHRGLAIPACITAHTRRTSRDACRDS